VNAQQYAELIEKHLLSCQYIEDKLRWPSKIEIPESDPNSLYWQDKIDLKQNLCLTVMEQAFFDDDEMIERSFSYDLHERGTDKLVWRIDNHCRRQSVANPCHVHAFPDDPEDRSKGFPDSKQTVFTYAIHCIKNHFEGKPQEWEETGNDEIS
jgi:hypothetical protein